jgi:hypothetical protein
MIRGMILADSCQPCVKRTLYHLCFVASNLCAMPSPLSPCSQFVVNHYAMFRCKGGEKGSVRIQVDCGVPPSILWAFMQGIEETD